MEGGRTQRFIWECLLSRGYPCRATREFIEDHTTRSLIRTRRTTTTSSVHKNSAPLTYIKQ